MPRKITRFFEWCGTPSTEYGIKLMDAFQVPIPALRGKATTATGRDGDLFLSDGAFDSVDIKRKIRVRLSRFSAVSGWLNSGGSNTLRFSEMPDFAYSARYNAPGKAVTFKRVTTDRDPLLEGDITFTCQPFRYLYPEPDAETFTAAGTIHNPGTVYSTPCVTINGTGDFSVTIGDETMYFSDITNGIVVDSELMDALTLDGTALMNQYVSGTPWRIQPGTNSVSWEVDSGASVSSVVILPRWRYV